MKRITVVLIFFVILPCCIMAQAKKKPTKETPPKQLCLFEKLFSVKPGMDMASGVAALQQLSKITLLEEVTEKLKPYAGTGGDSILHQTLTYRIDSTVCFKGRDNTVKFEFADGKLYKAYIETIYLQNEFPDMMVNFDVLHKQILKSWKIEKKITIKGESTEGIGYNFYKTLDKNVKLDMCTLQYVKTKGNSPGNDKYHLEMLWVNLNNTRMENSMY
ncbi:MAG TPA: hypothetical protein VFW07_10770 [Parafilimonas sp.]|nr:hypothetical protein [Parafilimonas sp.]